MRKTESGMSRKESICESAMMESHTLSGIQSLGFLRTDAMSRAPPPLSSTSTSAALMAPADCRILLAIMSAKSSLWRSKRPRWM